MKKILLLLFLVPLFWACGDDGDGAKPPFFVKDKLIVLHHKETAQIKVENADISKVSFNTEDDIVASVDSKGVITGVLIGETKITASCEGRTEKISVTVKPRYDLFTEAANFGATKQEVVALHKGKDKREKNNYIGFDYGKYKISYKIVDGVVDSYAYMTNISEIISDNVIGFLAERYIPVEYKSTLDGVFASFATKSKDLAVTFTANRNGNIMILYSKIPSK